MPVTKAYKAWSALKQRCLNPNNTEYNRYGGRGISVCDAWRKSFKTFLLDMGEPPTPGVTRAEQIVEQVMGDYLESLKRPNPYLPARHPAVAKAHFIALCAIRAIVHVVAIIL